MIKYKLSKSYPLLLMVVILSAAAVLIPAARGSSSCRARRRHQVLQLFRKLVQLVGGLFAGYRWHHSAAGRWNQAGVAVLISKNKEWLLIMLNLIFHLTVTSVSCEVQLLYFIQLGKPPIFLRVFTIFVFVQVKTRIPRMELMPTAFK